MKNESLTPNPSPKGEGSKMKNQELRTFSSAKPMKNENYTDGESKNNSSFYILHSSLTHAFLLASICVLTALFVPTPLRATDKIKSGGTWNDTSGSFINAHGGQVIFVDGYYYWFGETRKTSVSCYRSTDLMNWTRLADALSPSGSMTDDNKDIASGRNLERPKVAYNAQTNKWVMFIHWENGSDYGQAKVAVAQSDKVQGPYTLVDVFRPNDHDSRDQTIFVDTDGRAYHFGSTNMNTNMLVTLMSDDYLSPTTTETKILQGDKYEAPAIFKVGDTYFGLFSGCTGWDPNAGRLAYTQDIMGEWKHYYDDMQNYSYGENFCKDEGGYTSYTSQSTYVIKVEGKENAYIYMGDRWNSGNVASSKYVWLPLSVRSGYPAVRWYDAWDLSIFDDMYRYKRAKNITDDGEYLLIERRSDRVLSRKNSFTLENDDTTQNVVWNIIKTDNPYEFKLRQVSSGKFLESVFGTMRLQSESDRTAQRWRFVLQEDGYYRIENAEDGKCFTVSGSSTYAGTTVFLNDPDLKNFRSPAHQLFAVYFDSYKHPEYEEADLFSREYREENRRKIEEFELAMSVEAPKASTMDGQRHAPTVVYDIYGRRIADSLSQPLKQGIYIVGGRKYIK